MTEVDYSTKIAPRSKCGSWMFVRVDAQHNVQLMSVVRQWFHAVIEPLYGCQESALEKINAGVDRTCELIFNAFDTLLTTPLGILVYKNELHSEFEELYNLQYAFEIKTLFVNDAEHNSGRGIGTALFERAMCVATECVSQHIDNTKDNRDQRKNICTEKESRTIPSMYSMVVSVSTQKPQSLSFFKRRQFVEFASIVDCHNKDETEFFLYRAL